jgi:guanylate cyclase
MTPESAERIEQQMMLMAQHQSAPAYEDHITCVGDDENEIPCLMNLLALFNEDQLTGFVADIQDESELLAQQKEAESAKHQSEMLLNQILPPDIIRRLNDGESDISFSVPSATIMFIDIERFSAYAASLTPNDIMANLSLIFAAFDEACAKYSLLLKIKVIGDIYMCAGGLFARTEAPIMHAEQMIRFALDALQAIEHVNVSLDAALAVRIGVNTGGPIHAGVLGIEKPAFDIIGDAINVAARLQSTDLPGMIQISEGTFSHIAQLDFATESRGEIELKGKGKMRTYLIDPSQPHQINPSSSRFQDFALQPLPGTL